MELKEEFAFRGKGVHQPLEKGFNKIESNGFNDKKRSRFEPNNTHIFYVLDRFLNLCEYFFQSKFYDLR